MSLGRVPVALISLSALLGLAGCAGPGPVATTGVPTTGAAATGAAASASATSLPNPSAGQPTTTTSAAATASASTTTTATSSGPVATSVTTSAPTTSGPGTTTSGPVATTSGPARPSVPTTAARDVSAWPSAAFASPSGRIWCGLTARSALCHFPRGFRQTIPSSEEVCPGEGLDVTGVAVTASGTSYFCSGDPSAFPVRGQDSVAWHTATGYPWVAYDGFTLAVLPYGKALRHGDYVCASAENGVTCANRASGHGFRIALAGVDFF